MREQDREAARARAQIEGGRDLLRRADVRRETVGQELRDERARDEHALVDVEAEIAEPRLVREVGGGHALVDPALEELRDLRALGLREPRVEERLEPVERQVQRVQQQIGRLVVGVVGAVAERELRLAEARDGEAQPVAQRLEIVLGGRHARARGERAGARECRR